jgi:hypothetical protein
MGIHYAKGAPIFDGVLDARSPEILIYELHVWAWKDNPHGAFVDWHPNVSCEEYVGE